MTAISSPGIEHEATPIERAIQERRLGRFVISDQLRLNSPHAAWLVLAQTYIIRAEHRLDMDGTEYIGYCPYFDECRPDQMMRNYSPLVESDDRYNATITWK